MFYLMGVLQNPYIFLQRLGAYVGTRERMIEKASSPQHIWHSINESSTFSRTSGSWAKTLDAIGGNSAFRCGSKAGPMSLTRDKKIDSVSRNFFLSFTVRAARRGATMDETNGTIFCFDRGASIISWIPAPTTNTYGCCVSRSPSRNVMKIGL